MLKAVNALKLYTVAKALLDYTNNCGFSSKVETSQEEYDSVHSLFADCAELVGSSTIEHALQQVLKTNQRFFNEEEIAFLKDFIDELKEEEEA